MCSPPPTCTYMLTFSHFNLPLVGNCISGHKPRAHQAQRTHERASPHLGQSRARRLTAPPRLLADSALFVLQRGRDAGSSPDRNVTQDETQIFSSEKYPQLTPTASERISTCPDEPRYPSGKGGSRTVPPHPRLCVRVSACCACQRKRATVTLP